MRERTQDQKVQGERNKEFKRDVLLTILFSIVIDMVLFPVRLGVGESGLVEESLKLVYLMQKLEWKLGWTWDEGKFFVGVNR